MRGLVAAMVMIEVEQSIKRYLLEHPEHLPDDAEITTVDDFIVNLVDYFDCMTGVSAGGESALYLASRGGQGTSSRTLMEMPEIVERYGIVPNGVAEGVRIFFREFGSIVYPIESLGNGEAAPFDLTNPQAPGVMETLYPAEGFIEAVEASFGNTTLADLDTTVYMPVFDLLTGRTTFFVQNAFRDVPVTSSAQLIPRVGPKTAQPGASGFSPDLVFDEGKDYYLVDIALGVGSAAMFLPARSTSQVNNDTEEFSLIDVGPALEDAALYATFFVAEENGMSNFEDIAVLSIGTSGVTPDYTFLANTGLAGYLQGLTFQSLPMASGLSTQVTLMDYLFYSNPKTKPYQYLRVQSNYPTESEEGMAYGTLNQNAVVDIFEEMGIALAELYRDAIDIFVRDFIFG